MVKVLFSVFIAVTFFHSIHADLRRDDQFVNGKTRELKAGNGKKGSHKKKGSNGKKQHPKMKTTPPSLNPSTHQDSTPPTTKTNFNECFPLLGALEACRDLDDIVTCCDHVESFLNAKCSCHSGFDVLSGGQLPFLEPLCKSINDQIEWISPGSLQCRELDTYNYGCGENDMELESKRLASVLGFEDLFLGIDDCFDSVDFVEKLRSIAREDLVSTIPYGIGIYKNISNTAEYLGMTYSGLNHNFWKPGSSSLTGEYDLTFFPDGRISISTSSEDSYFDGALLNKALLMGSYDLSFEGCETQFSRFNVLETADLRQKIELYVATARFSKRWGAEDICKYHDLYCAGKTGKNGQDLTQYENNAACLEYMNSLPNYTEKCTSQRPLAGNSLPCRFKHHFMIPVNPSRHCPHIGVAGTIDEDGFAKCTDGLECSEQVPLKEGSLVNADIFSQDLLDIFELSNDGWEDEETGCGIAEDGTPFGRNQRY